MANAVLTLNAGSSSIKFALYEADSGSPRLVSRGVVEGIGIAPHFLARDAYDVILQDQTLGDQTTSHESLLGTLLDWIDQHLGVHILTGVGHRIVHGGPHHDRPVLVTPELLTELDRLTPLAPLHQLHNLSPIHAVTAARPDLPQVVCFDTAFHHGMPAIATRFALPHDYATEGVRRYGFHGLSYEYIARHLRELDPALAAGRVIVAHLGNGASLCAMRDGRSMDTSMGLTPLDGLVMGTRCGDLDPGAILYLAQEHGMDAKLIEDLLYHHSGLLGVSGISSDMRKLLASDDPHAAEAVELFVFRLARQVGALASTLGGLDGFVFTAGIGEHAAEIRAKACDRLAWLGLSIDEQSNARNADVISAPGSRVVVRVIPTDEEGMIARHVLEIVGHSP